jgi:hypothetical protein
MATAGEWPYRFALIPLTDLFVDAAYQRPLSSFAKRIEENYDPAMVGTLIVSDRGSKGFAVIDGQTRMEGMEKRGETVAPCLVYENLTRKQEAELFARLQTERRGMATWIRFRAALVSGNAEAAAIAALVQAEGFKVAGDGDDKGIKSIAALEWLYRRDPALLRQVLGVVRDAWGIPDSTTTRGDVRTRGEILQGIGRFLRETENVDEDRLVRNLSTITAENLRHRANALREGSGSAGNYSMFIRDALMGVYAARPRSSAAA